MRLVFFIAALLFIASCTEKPKPAAGGSTTNTSNPAGAIDKPDSLLLEAFPMPDSIEGCTGYLAADSTQLSHDNYLFATRLTDSIAIIQVNGKAIRLKLQRRHSGEEDALSGIYAGEGYELELKQRELRQEDLELFIYTGTLILRYGQSSQSFAVYGEWGC